MTYYVTLCGTPGCCGVEQILGMGEEDQQDAGQKLSAVSWPEMLKCICAAIKDGVVVQVWFVDEVDWKGRRSGAYNAGELRDLIRALPNVVHLGEFCNPNSNNYIDGYQWINNE